MYQAWTREELKEAWKRTCELYSSSPVSYRFICGHCIQCEGDEDELDYYMIGVWLVKKRRYREWSEEKSYDLAWIIEFMRFYEIPVPRYIRRTLFYRRRWRKMLQNTFQHKESARN